MPTIIIPGWPSTDKVPGSFGEVKYGAGAQSAQSQPKKCLVVGLKSSSAGSITVDTQVAPITSVADADTNGGAGGEATCMAYDALQIPGTVLFMACPTSGAGAVAATAVIRIQNDGTPWSTSGTWIGRFAGVKGQKATVLQVGIGATDTATTAGASIAAAINSNPQLPYTASNNAGLITLTCTSVGPRGNQHIFFQDISQLPAHCQSFIGGQELSISSSTNANPIVVTTSAPHGMATGTLVQIAGHATNTAANGTWSITNTGASTFSIAVAGNGVGGATGKVYGPQVPGNGAQFFGGTTVETYTNLLATLLPYQFDRIALACNDATSLAAWKSQIDAQAGVLSGLLQHVVFGTNGTLAAAQSLAQTTLNDQRFQCLWHLNSETHPSRVASAFAAFRSVSESQDPGAAAIYGNYAFQTVQPQSQPGDWANHATQVSALNNGVTPVTTTGDGNARVIRAIVTHSLTGSNADYSTFDVCDATVPDFILQDIQVYDRTTYFISPSNPSGNSRVADDPPQGAKALPAGTATPSLRNAAITAKLRDYEQAINLPAQLIVNVSQNLPVSAYDTVGKRILTAVNVQVAPPNLQVGNSVRQIAA